MESTITADPIAEHRNPHDRPELQHAKIGQIALLIAVRNCIDGLARLFRLGRGLADQALVGQSRRLLRRWAPSSRRARRSILGVFATIRPSRNACHVVIFGFFQPTRQRKIRLSGTSGPFPMKRRCKGAGEGARHSRIEPRAP